MKIIKQSAVYIGDGNSYEKIERCGRICYKSEDKITDGSAIKFCKAMLKNQHLAMLEHATIYIKTDNTIMSPISDWMNSIKTGADAEMITPYINISAENLSHTIISMSFRTVTMAIKYIASHPDMTTGYGICDLFYKIVNHYNELFNRETIGNEAYNMIEKHLVKNNESRFEILDKNQFIEFAKTYGEKGNAILNKHLTHTIVFTTNRGVTHELVRHRPASFAQESTRYCNYSKGQFGGEITVIEPCYFTDNDVLMNIWREKAQEEEKAYFALLNAGATAQQARGLLPHDVKADIVITATESEWQHIINLRYHGTTGAPHPQAKEAMTCAMPLLSEKSDGRLH